MCADVIQAKINLHLFMLLFPVMKFMKTKSLRKLASSLENGYEILITFIFRFAAKMFTFVLDFW